MISSRLTTGKNENERRTKNIAWNNAAEEAEESSQLQERMRMREILGDPGGAPGDYNLVVVVNKRYENYVNKMFIGNGSS
jgi:hypothetical protein